MRHGISEGDIPDGLFGVMDPYVRDRLVEGFGHQVLGNTPFTRGKEGRGGFLSNEGASYGHEILEAGGDVSGDGDQTVLVELRLLDVKGPLIISIMLGLKPRGLGDPQPAPGHEEDGCVGGKVP